MPSSAPMTTSWPNTSVENASNGKGPRARYDKLVNDILNRDLSTSSNYQLLQSYLDVEKYIDYVLIAWWCGLEDWPRNNFYGGLRSDESPLGSTAFRYFAWDGEWAWDRPRVGTHPTGRARVHQHFKNNYSVTSSTATIAKIWHALKVNNTFMAAVKSRVDYLTATGRPLNDQVALTRWQVLNATIENAVVAEPARWGDSLESIDGKTRTRDVEWQSTVDTMSGIIIGNAQALKNSMQQEGYY